MRGFTLAVVELRLLVGLAERRRVASEWECELAFAPDRGERCA
jgi:hypothetical protein